MAHLTRPPEISGVSAGSFPETAAGNRAYVLPQNRQSAKTADWLENNDVKWLFSRNCACANSKDSK